MNSVLVLLLPALGAVLVGLVRNDRGAVVALGSLATLGTFVAALFLPGSAGVSAAWLPGVGVGFDLDPGGAASVLVLVAALVMIPTVLVGALRSEQTPGGFVALLLLAQATLNGVFLAKDLVLFYVFWEATLIPSLVLLGVYGGERRRDAVVKYLVYAASGSFLMLVAIISLKVLSGSPSFHVTDLMLAATDLSVNTQSWLFVGLAAGMLVKLPLWPVHSWLVALNEQNHHSGAADVLGTLYKVGGFGFFAWALPILPLAAERWAPVLLALAAFTAVYGALIATAQTHLKRLLAYASLSHMGVVGVGVFALHIAGLNGAMYFLAAQMLSTGGLFIVAGMLYRRRRSFDVDAYGGLARSAPALAAVSLTLIFAFIGVPGLGNFPGEFLSLLGAFQASAWFGVIATLAVIAAGVYGVNVFQRLFQGAENGTVDDLSPVEVYLLVPFVAGVIWLGIAPQPQLDLIEPQSQLVTLQLETAQVQGQGSVAEIDGALVEGGVQ